MSYLSRADGPACTRCGCRDTRVLKEPQSVPAVKDGAQVGAWQIPGTALCRHCGTKFDYQTAGEEDEERQRPATYQEAGAQCPHCQSWQTSVVSSPAGERRKIRYHKCGDCTKTFKTVSSEGPDLRLRA